MKGVDEWRNFTAVVDKAKTACEVSGHAVTDRFADIGKMIQMPKGTARVVSEKSLKNPDAL